MPANDSAAAFAQDIISLARANPDAIGADTRPLVYEAEAVLSQSLNFAEQQVSGLTKAYAEALVGRESAAEVEKRFARARELLQVQSSFRGIPDSSGRLRAIDSRLADLRQLLGTTQIYNVRLNNSRGNTCNGVLSVDGFAVKFLKSSGLCENFVRKFDEVQLYRSQAVVEVRSTQSGERWQVENTEGATREAREQKARDIMDAVTKLANLRERFNR